MNFKSVAVIALLPLVAACGKSAAPLSSDQKSSLKETTDSAGRATNSARAANGKTSNARIVSESLLRFNAAQSNTINCTSDNQGNITCDDSTAAGSSSGSASIPSASPAPTAPSTTTDSTQTEMADALKNAKCDIAVNEDGKSSLFDLSGGNSSASKKQFSVKVSGDSCPVELAFDGSASMASTEMAVDLSLNYNVKDDAFRKLNDVDAAQLAGSMKASQEAFNIEMNGKLHSAKRGDVKIKVSGSGKAEGNSGKGEITASYEFKDFTAELKYVVDGKDESYTLNGEKITKSEFMDYLNKTIGSN